VVNYQKRLLNAYKKDKNMKLNEVHKKLSNYINDKVQLRDNPQEAAFHTTKILSILEDFGYIDTKMPATRTFDQNTQCGILESRAASHKMTLNAYVKAVQEGRIKE
jgi:hypothetical protein